MARSLLLLPSCLLPLVLQAVGALELGQSDRQAVLAPFNQPSELHDGDASSGVADDALARSRLEDGELERLARQFAPIVYLSEGERYLPSSLAHFLPALVPLSPSSDPIPHPLPLTPSNLASSPGWSYDNYLAAVSPPIADERDHPYNAQPPDDLDEGRVDGRVFGQREAELEGKWEAKAVVVEKSEKGVVDIYYWTYYPFNKGKEVGPLGVVGNHLSDWEAMSVRTRDGAAVSVDYLSHESPFGYGTMRWEDAPKEDGRPVAFSANGSHGLWPTAGEHTYARALSFTLTDVTSRGIRWPLASSLEVLPYFRPSPPEGRMHRRRRRFEGDRMWANWLGRWGDNGGRGCWWWGLFPECGLVDGPRGPLRDSETWPPMCISGKVAAPASLKADDPRSTYALVVSPSLLSTPLPALALQQTCRPIALAPTLPDLTAAPPRRDDPSEETTWTWVSVEDFAEGDEGERRGHVDVTGCQKGFYVVSYSIALAPSVPSATSRQQPGKRADCPTCTYVGATRLLCVFDDGADGGRTRSGEKTKSPAVDVDDIDWWGWPA